MKIAYHLSCIDHLQAFIGKLQRARPQFDTLENYICFFEALISQKAKALYC